MLRLEIIEPSISSWWNPSVLVPKPDGSIHFSIDFREVNKLATFDEYFMLCTDVLLSQLGSIWYMSVLYLTKG